MLPCRPVHLRTACLLELRTTFPESSSGDGFSFRFRGPGGWGAFSTFILVACGFVETKRYFLKNMLIWWRRNATLAVGRISGLGLSRLRKYAFHTGLPSKSRKTHQAKTSVTKKAVDSTMILAHFPFASSRVPCGGPLGRTVSL